jgi:hypothetical protein
MDGIGFIFFCVAVGYVIVWFLVNESRGNENGEWGLLTIRQSDKSALRVDRHAGHDGTDIKRGDGG